MAKDPIIQDPNQMSVALGSQLFLTHFLAAGTAVLLFILTAWTGSLAQWALTLGFSGMVGFLLTLNLQRSLRIIDFALIQILSMMPVTDLNRKAHGPVKGLIEKLQMLADRERPFAQQHKQQLQQASQHAAQEERNRLARDLHDSIKQQLFGINISAAAAQAQLGQNPQKVETSLEDVRGSAKAALVEMNALLHQLSPEPLEKVGLVQALQEQCEALGYRTGATVQAKIGQLPDDEQFPIGSGSQEAIFRIAQEALSNVARHARADTVTLTLHQETSAERDNLKQQTLVLEIADDGQGFDKTAVSPGMGLNNIQQRVQELGGQLTITTKPKQGSSIRIVVPFTDYRPIKEQIMAKTDHTLNKYGLLGLGGAAALVAILFYPLYIVLPGLYLTDWYNGSPPAGIGLMILALPLLIGIGFAGAKQLNLPTRKAHITAAAILGGVSAALFYFFLGGAAAVVWGSQILLTQGAVPAQTELEFLYYITETVNSIILAVSVSFWLVVGLGLLLGAVGGLFTSLPDKAGAAINREDLYSLLPAIGIASISSALILTITTFIYAPLGEQVASSAQKVAVEGFTLKFSANASNLWPVLTAFLVYLICLLFSYGLLRLNRHDPVRSHQRDHMMMAQFIVLITAFLPVSFFASLTDVPIIFMGLMLVNLLFCFLFWHLSLQFARSFPFKREQESKWVRIGDMLPMITAVLIFIIAWQGNGLVAFAIWSIGIILFLATWRRDTSLTPEEKAVANQQTLPRTFSILVCSILALGLSIMPLNVMVSGLVLIPIPAIAPLNALFEPTNQGASINIAAQVQQLYRLQPVMVALTLAVAAMAIGVIVVVLKVSMMRQK